MVLRVLLILTICSFSISCNQPPSIVLTRSELKLSDSLFLARRGEWSPKLEDSCNAFRDKMLPIWTDSLKALRLSEINLMLDQYAKEK
ncbi:MAG: hypothetical protein KDC80_05440 [Saprospiraceae bacterium]|nr:hypothetical protein [Saprospiraceae bacterium]